MEDKVFELLTEMYSKMTEQFKEVNNKITVMDSRLTGMENNLTEVDSRLTGMENNLTEVDSRLIRMDSNLTAVNNKLDEKADKSDIIRLENELNPKVRVLFDGYKQHTDMLERIEKEVTRQDEIIMRRVK